MSTYAELQELIQLSEASIDYQFQFWLTVTFATIVASFAARHVLTNRLRLIISSLYLLATFVFASRWYYDVQSLLEYGRLLEEIGHLPTIPYATGIGRSILMAFGTFAAIYFVHFGARYGAANGTGDQTVMNRADELL